MAKMRDDFSPLEKLGELSEMLTYAFQVVAELQDRFADDQPLSGSDDAGSLPRASGKAKKSKKKSKRRTPSPLPITQRSPVLPFTVPEEEAVNDSPGASEESCSPSPGRSSLGSRSEDSVQSLSDGTQSASPSAMDVTPTGGTMRTQRAAPRPQGRAQTSQSADNASSEKRETPRMRATRSEGPDKLQAPRAHSFAKITKICPSNGSSEDALNSRLFDLAGINITRGEAAGGSKMVKVRSNMSKPNEVLNISVAPVQDGANSAPLASNPAAEGVPPDQLFKPSRSMAGKKGLLRSSVRSKRPITLGSCAHDAMQEHVEQAVAELEAEAKTAQQVLGCEVLWSQSREGEKGDARGARCRFGCVVLGVRTYTALVKLGGLSPLWPEKPLASKSYAVCVRLVVTWAAVHPLVLAGGFRTMEVLSTELLLAVGAALSLLLLTIRSRDWGLAETSQRLSVMAHQAGFLNALARSSSISTGIMVALGLCAGALRLVNFLLKMEAGDLSRDLPALVSSLVVFYTLTTQALYLHRIASALVGTVDHFTTIMVRGEDASWGRDQWKLTMALCSDVNSKLQRGLLVLQLMLTAFLPMLAFELRIRGTSFLDLVPGLITALIVLTAFGRVSGIASQCQAIPSMLGRLPVSDEAHDAGLISLMARIRDTSAPVQILGVGITPGLVCKTCYTVATVTIFLVLNFQKELDSFQN